MKSVLTRHFPMLISVCGAALLFCIPGKTANLTSSRFNEINQTLTVGNFFSNVSQGFIITVLDDPTPTITNFTPQTGLPGSSVTITGTNFINPSAVRFNGIDATFTVNSTTQITATVPVGNTSGPITVATSGGTATSFSSFVGPPSYAVSGHIADAGNNPVAGVTVAFELDSQGTITSTSTVTDASGNYAAGIVGAKTEWL
jgi:IPT/TIG domain